MLSLAIRAINTSELMTLHIDRQDDGVISLCLVGKHEGKDIQIDFEEMSVDDAEDFIVLLRRRIDTTRGNITGKPLPTQTQEGE